MPENLEFSGNWYVDIGILGFVKLMKEVYCWDLEKLKEMISRDHEKVYYGYFPFAYFYKWCSDRNENVDKEIVSSLVKNLEESGLQNKTEELFNYVWFKYICKLFTNLWVENKLKILHKKDAYDKKDKVKKQFNYTNSQKYLQLICEREKFIYELQKNHLEDIKKILENEKLKMVGYDEIKYLLNIDLDNNSYPTIPNKVKELIAKLKETHSDIENFLKEEWKKIIQTEKIDEKDSHFYRLPIDSAFYKNFLFFNNFAGNLEQKQSFYYMLSSNFDKEEILDRIDKTINKFLPSESEFINISYTKLSTTIFKNQYEYIFVYLICFTYGIENYKNLGYVVFYSNDLAFTYSVNKKLKLYKEKIKVSTHTNKIFKVTWQQIIDFLVEYKSTWSLENMYIISYQSLDNQFQKGVRYIGIHKLQASLLLDDKIREALNTRIKCKNASDEGDRCWLLEEFIQGKPLYPIILNHINLTLTSDENFNWTSCLYGLLVDAYIANFRGKNKTIFSDNFFDNYKALVKEIKEEVRITTFFSSLISNISDEIDTRKRVARELYTALCGKDKKMFLNILLKNLNENTKLSSNINFQKWILEKIIANDTSFEMHCLILVMSLLRG